MLTVSPHLTVRQPSPTTIEYTVTTRPPSTIPVRLGLVCVNLLRIFFGVILLLLLYAKWQLSPYSTPLQTKYNLTTLPYSIDELFTYFLSTFHESEAGVVFSHFASSLPVALLIPLSAFLTTLLLTPLHTTETLLILRGLGIQTSSSPTSYFIHLLHIPGLLTRRTTASSGMPGALTRFIPVEKVQDLFVNEVFMGWGVRYMLGVVVEGEEEIMVVFPTLLPQRGVVERVWRGGREALWGEGKNKR